MLASLALVLSGADQSRGKVHGDQCGVGQTAGRCVGSRQYELGWRGPGGVRVQVKAKECRPRPLGESCCPGSPGGEPYFAVRISQILLAAVSPKYNGVCPGVDVRPVANKLLHLPHVVLVDLPTDMVEA